MSTPAAEVGRFTYCKIPAGNDAIEEFVFEGSSDQELRDGISSYFGQAGMTEGQKREFAENLKEQVKENAKKGAVGQAPEVDTTQITNQYIQQAALKGGSFEIVPVIYPDATNGYKGVSLYIDQVGRFKELPLNERASKIAQRDIRGDAFVISSYDDPVKDSWARVSCTKQQLEGLIAAPPEQAADPQARAAAMQASMQTKLLKEEDMCKARDLKQAGNTAIGKGNYDEAAAKYTEALQMLLGRTDEVDTNAWGELNTTLYLNRAQAHLKLGKLKDAVTDCSTVLGVAPDSLKALYRRASAYRAMKEFDMALADVQEGRKYHPNDDLMAKLEAQVVAERADYKKKEKARFSNMFA